MKFVSPRQRVIKRDFLEIYPEFLVMNTDDIMIRGNDLYAFWDEENKIWSHSQNRLFELIDKDLYSAYNEIKEKDQASRIIVRYMKDNTSGSARMYKQWIRQLMTDGYDQLDDKLIFANQEIRKEDHCTKKLSYPLVEGTYEAWDELIGTLYSPEERHKIEWSIGSIVNGDSKWIQKFVIFVGDAGTGKSTVLNIIRMLFDGYTASIDAKALGNPNSSFALEPFKSNPLVAIQDDADLSHIEDNTRLNSLVSHERIVVNEKHKSMYENEFHSFIFLGSNREVMITDARSGLLRRLIDVEPSGRRIEFGRYLELMDQIKFELSGIAWHCKEVYESDKRFYDRYFPVRMIRATNQIYNFVEDCMFEFIHDDYVELSVAWRNYKEYCNEAMISYPLTKQKFKTELMVYFKEFLAETHIDGVHLRNVYKGFKYEKLGIGKNEELSKENMSWLRFEKVTRSVFDILGELWPAQYANESGVPSKKWSNNTDTLSDIDTKWLHYVKVPENHIVIDFDLKDENSNKSFEKNFEAARTWPKTYAELSKSGEGIHLHYIYDGDVNKLKSVYADDIEIKVFKGDSSLRRRLTKCVNLPIATISSGLPLKEGGKEVIEFNVLANEKAIRTVIQKNLDKEYHPGTKPSIDFIFKVLEDAYNAGIDYDVTDLRPAVLAFANNSSNHAEYCVGKVADMHFCQDIDISDNNRYDRLKGGVVEHYAEDAPIAFFDVEVFPNLFVVVYLIDESYEVAPDILELGKKCVKLINPTVEDIEKLLKYRLIGFNNRRYDNHILYGRLLGYSNEQLYNLSKKIIDGSRNAMFHEAYNLSYTDIYDFASNTNKMGLKKWEIKLDIHHLELGLPWDKPVDERLWGKVADYCINDVVSTREVFYNKSVQGDWIARQILTDLSGLTVNDSTNSHTTKIIFGGNRHPQTEFNYRDLSKPVTYLDPEVKDFLWERFPDMMKWWSENTDSLLPYFPGYVYDHGKSTYKGEEVGEGGFVTAIPGMYGYVGLLDVASMHPHSTLTECLFGVEYTKKYAALLDGRIDIKHTDWEQLDISFDGKLNKYVQKVLDGEITSKQLSNALKTAINSVYGLTSAGFENPFRDVRNKDNIVAKRGALFMIDLAEEVRNHGYTVAHIKTDSIKIPDITPEMVDFVMEFGKRYGYTFEWEATYDKMTLVNDAVYIARYRNDDGSVGEWTATGAQFQEPFVFKTLFSHEDLVFKDYCQTKNVTSALYLDMNEDLPDVSEFEKQREKLVKKGEDVSELDEEIAKGHNYIFVGSTGSFCPIKEGCGGGILVREKDGKYYSVGGGKGYRWLEAELVKNLEKQDDIDISYFVNLVDKAVASIEEFGNFMWFVDPAPYDSTVPYGTEPVDDFMNLPEPEDDDTPPWEV